MNGQGDKPRYELVHYNNLHWRIRDNDVGSGKGRKWVTAPGSRIILRFQNIHDAHDYKRVLEREVLVS